MNIYEYLRGKELPLADIPSNLSQQLEDGIADGFITSRFINGIAYYSLTLNLLKDPGLPDIRDYNYSLIYGASAPKVAYTIKSADIAEWVVQGARNTCTAWATVEAKRIMDLQKFDYITMPPAQFHLKQTDKGSTVNDLPPNYFSAEYIFKKSNGTTEGASPQNALNAARKGMILEQDELTTVYGSYIYPIPTTTVQNYKPTDHSIDGYASCTSFNQILDALNTNKPVYLCYALTSSYNQVILGSTDEFPTGGSVIGYHASVCVGYETRRDIIFLKIQQTYEGKFKYNYMSPDYFKKHISKAWALIDTKEVELIQSLNSTIKDSQTPSSSPLTQTPVQQQNLVKKLKSLIPTKSSLKN